MLIVLAASEIASSSISVVVVITIHCLVVSSQQVLQKSCKCIPPGSVTVVEAHRGEISHTTKISGKCSEYTFLILSSSADIAKLLISLALFVNLIRFCELKCLPQCLWVQNVPLW
jgi:hypothetical protein